MDDDWGYPEIPQAERLWSAPREGHSKLPITAARRSGCCCWAKGDSCARDGSMYVCHINGLPFTMNKNPSFVRIYIYTIHTDPSWVVFFWGFFRVFHMVVNHPENGKIWINRWVDLMVFLWVDSSDEIWWFWSRNGVWHQTTVELAICHENMWLFTLKVMSFLKNKRVKNSSTFLMFATIS